MPANKIEKLTWEAHTQFQCKVKPNSYMTLEKYLNSNFQFCDSLLRIKAARQILSHVGHYALAEKLKEIAVGNDTVRASNAFYLLILMSDYVKCAELKIKNPKYTSPNPLHNAIHAFIKNPNKIIDFSGNPSMVYNAIHLVAIDLENTHK